MGRLILAGGGDAEQTLLIDKEFVNLINTDKPLLYIPIAMDTKFIPYESCFKWIKGVFNPLGIDNIIMWTEYDLINKQIEDLNQFSAVYIGGGNTFSLLEDFNKTLFTNVLKEYVVNDGIIYGGSAGAIILGKDIGTCSHMDSNDLDLKELNGLGLVEDYSIWCHYKVEDDILISNYLLEYKNPVISLPEETALLLNEEGMKVIGAKPAFIFDGKIKKTIQPGHYC
ncbi:Type 1 glutamine amidotransferase-like domain-containing protein [Bacillus alkalicellulosilyticus]|uniref:Type 1 glutamine amidotransferase-like domain-containing protein n=1 Tax=Alkalihalobacterium alkalicellulosilyticum TaxID=1912214 RepID=UPI000996921F|nr:Type 1 glutamine amidotransferase-like domain-containing protein [Bacillus alkalicellulosilyticus]